MGLRRILWKRNYSYNTTPGRGPAEVANQIIGPKVTFVYTRRQQCGAHNRASHVTNRRTLPDLLF